MVENTVFFSYHQTYRQPNLARCASHATPVFLGTTAILWLTAPSECTSDRPPLSSTVRMYSAGTQGSISLPPSPAVRREIPDGCSVFWSPPHHHVHLDASAPAGDSPVFERFFA